MDNRNFDLALAISARCTGPYAPSPVISCERTLRIGFFFDGFGRHLIKDLASGRVSNVGKLFLAHPIDMPNTEPDPFFAYRKVYVSGLGEDYDADLTTTATAAMASFGSTASEIPEDTARDQALEAAKDALGGRRWWERPLRELGELLRKPHKAAGALKGAVLDASLEAIPAVRDSSIGAELLKLGAKTRIEGAMDRLNRDINEIRASGGPPLKRIELSVYGFDYGATLARAFLHELLGRCLDKGEGVHDYQGARLIILFAGFFDAVDRSRTLLPLLDDLQPLRTSLEDQGRLPAAVRQALHLVAAHERRFHRRVRLLGDARPEWREELVPGVSEDVGGGLLPGEHKPSAELALVSLHRMYREAFRAGVPFTHIDDLNKHGRKLSSLFTFNDHFNGHTAQTMVKHYQTAVEAMVGGASQVQVAFTGHMRLYIRWLASLWRPYRARQREITEELQWLDATQYRGGGVRGLLGLPLENRERREWRQARSQALRDEQRALYDQFGWLAEVNEEAKALRNRLDYLDGYAAVGTPQQEHITRALLAEWYALKPPPLTKASERLFSHFIHDRLVLDVAQRSAKSLGGQYYFDIRGYDRPEA